MGNENIADGLPRDGVSTYPASDNDMQLYWDASVALSRFKSPVFLHSNDAHERLYVAAFDGTGNDKFKDPLHATNVAKIENQVEELLDSGRQNIAVGYVPGPGTEDHAIRRVLDGAIGFTHETR